MYFDAVVDKQMRPVFNGTPDETKEWLRNNLEDPDIGDLNVCDGRTLAVMPVSIYLNAN